MHVSILSPLDILKNVFMNPLFVETKTVRMHLLHTMRIFFAMKYPHIVQLQEKVVLYKEYSCEDLLTKTKCTQDYQGKSCLWMNLTQTCVTFSQCSDVKKTTLSECQQYSEQCTSNGINCISYQKCSEYTNSTSCKKGTDGECGWVIEQLNQEPKCQIFQNVAPKRTVNNTRIPVLLTVKIALKQVIVNHIRLNMVGNSSGIDGPCFWNESQSPPVCRLQQCVDIPLVPYMTYQYCSTFNPKLNCTTNTIYCVDKKLCSSYSEQECYEGTDGPCVFAIPLKQSSGTKQCRAKDCTDYIETTTEACSKLQIWLHFQMVSVVLINLIVLNILLKPLVILMESMEYAFSRDRNVRK
ncbi:unnamed protein product (macronuclear) [Paramecium tetraurelia]|uniref:FZ domain-containing protein n=1 Tax=Paramecium tetraurelia TaxID=5888 RepID=A0CNX6_PARTE|nr:uncharacterized protein GSPATT00038762001 [Paramecium tetraurelia]CAK72493.1 unnamed protein product [Paramecium tetraurelia]|eukprot:XP_001439890.1 hypothetical protein (macronuclear) [Paramecium tetraurelia strain d4-2]